VREKIVLHLPFLLHLKKKKMMMRAHLKERSLQNEHDHRIMQINDLEKKRRRRRMLLYHQIRTKRGRHYCLKEPEEL